MADRTVSVQLRLLVSEFVAGSRAAAGAARDFRDELIKSKDASKKLGDGMLVAGGALAGGFLFAAKAAADFDKQMSAVSAVSNASAKDLNGLRTAAIAAGKDTQFSATEAAKAEEELAKAGIATADIIGGGLKGALSLAAAGSLDLAEAADVAAKAMNTFGLTGKDVPHIADVLAAAANKSATDVHELGFALKMSGLAARNSGLSLEETTGVLAAFADNALVGSDAGTSLKTMLQFLANPTDKARGLMEQLGVSAYDASGNFVGIAKFAGILTTKLSGLTQEQRNAALATIFGSDATRAATVLYKLGSGGIQDYIDKVNDSGAAAKTAAEKTNNLAGDLERLKGSLETVAIESGSGANKGLRTLTQTAQGLVDAFGSLPGPVQSTIVILAGVSGAGLLAAGGLLKVKNTVTDALGALRDMGPAGEKAAGGISRVGSVAGKIGLVGIGVMVALEGLNAFSDWAEKRTAPAKANIDNLTESIKEFVQTGRAVGELASKYGDSLQKIGGDVNELTRGLAALNYAAEAGAGLMDNTFAGEGPDPASVQRIKDLDTALTQLVQNGGATQAKIFLDQLRDSGKLTAEQYGQLIAQLPQYTAAAQAAAAAGGPLAKGFGNAEQNARSLKQSLDDLVAAGQSVMDVFNQLNGGALGVSDAEIAAETGARNLTAALKESKGSLDITTEAGGKARQALNDMARKAAEAGQAVYNQTGSAQAAAAEIAKYRQKLIDAAVAAGMARAEAERLANEIIQMPPGKDINFNVTTRYITKGKPAQTQGFQPGNFNADGAIYERFASGGESHLAQIAPAGAMRIWAEPETGGEAYIPLADAKRARSTAILADVNRRFGNPLGNMAVYQKAGNTYNITVQAADGMSGRMLGAEIVAEIKQYEKSNGTNWRRTRA